MERMEESVHNNVHRSLTSWDQAVPTFLGSPQFLPKIRYTVTPGTFVTATIHNREEIVRILSNPVSSTTSGQAVGGGDSSCVKVNLFSRLGPLLREYAAKSMNLER